MQILMVVRCIWVITQYLIFIGRGSIHVKFSDGRIRRFDGVLHIPRLARNFLSISKLIAAGVHVQFSEAGVKMVRGARLKAQIYVTIFDTKTYFGHISFLYQNSFFFQKLKIPFYRYQIQYHYYIKF